MGRDGLAKLNFISALFVADDAFYNRTPSISSTMQNVSFQTAILVLSEGQGSVGIKL